MLNLAWKQTMSHLFIRKQGKQLVIYISNKQN